MNNIISREKREVVVFFFFHLMLVSVEKRKIFPIEQQGKGPPGCGINVRGMFIEVADGRGGGAGGRLWGQTLVGDEMAAAPVTWIPSPLLTHPLARPFHPPPATLATLAHASLLRACLIIFPDYKWKFDLISFFFLINTYTKQHEQILN